jgi:hypothetical protein
VYVIGLLSDWAIQSFRGNPNRAEPFRIAQRQLNTKHKFWLTEIGRRMLE